MLKLVCWCLSLLFLITLNFVSIEARPQVKLPQILTKNITNTAANFVKNIISNSSRNETNKAKTRILFRGDLLADLNEQDIIFPDAYQIIFEHFPKIRTTPKCAEGKTFCEEFESYPFQHVKELLQRKPVRTDFFGKDEAPDDRYSITNRNGDVESFVCTSYQKTIFPRVGKNKNNKWKFIINQEEKDGYIQGVRVEICRKEGSACDLIGEQASGYITSCKQKYMMRRLMSLSETGDPIADTFQFPSACCCSYRKDLSFLARITEESAARSKEKPKT